MFHLWSSAENRRVVQRVPVTLKKLEIRFWSWPESGKTDCAHNLFLLFKATELKHLHCLAEELQSLEEVLNLAQGKNSTIKDLMNNINVTVLELKVRITVWMQVSHCWGVSSWSLLMITRGHTWWCSGDSIGCWKLNPGCNGLTLGPPSVFVRQDTHHSLWDQPLKRGLTQIVSQVKTLLGY